jgi:hypothetical protein
MEPMSQALCNSSKHLRKSMFRFESVNLKEIDMKNVISTIGLTIISFAVAISVAAESTYTIPDELKPMSTWRNGWTAEETYKYRQEYNKNTLTGGEDDGAYAITHLSEVLPTAIVHRSGPISSIDSAPMPEIENVVATTDLGTMTLREMMDDRRSRMRAIAVVHKGKLVYENYIGIRPWDNHIWASATKSVVGLVSYLLEKEGKLDLHKTVGYYMPQFRGTAWEHIEVADALHQRSAEGLSDAEPSTKWEASTRATRIRSSRTLSLSSIRIRYPSGQGALDQAPEEVTRERLRDEYRSVHRAGSRRRPSHDSCEKQVGSPRIGARGRAC